MSKVVPACCLAIAVTLAPLPADAQIYELIKVCMRKWQTAVACIVIEKGVEKIVEKSAEDWLSYYRKSKDAPPPPATAPPSPALPRSPPFGEITRNGTDFRALMKDLDSKVGTAPVKSGKDLVGVLGSRCGLVSDSVACREFKPLFRMETTAVCAAHLSPSTCAVDVRCTWSLNSCTVKSTR